jgi:glycosyltransferase involved in cell wall biosynthesis
MNWTTQCAAVIPCLNERASIGTLVSAVLKHFPATLVVDDGSSDGTALAAQRAGAEVIRHARSLGKGAALQTGWTAARERGFEWTLTLDGDGQHSPDDIPRFLSCAERSSAELVVGNRMDDPATMPWVRYRVNRWMSWQISKLAEQHFPDSQCGFRLMNLNAWSGLPISAAHFEIESAVLLGFARAGRRIEFVPIQVIYKSEQSKIHPVRDTLRWFRWHRAAKLEQPAPPCLPRPETVPYPQK